MECTCAVLILFPLGLEMLFYFKNQRDFMALPVLVVFRANLVLLSQLTLIRYECQI
jgi:hypothetical protein